MMKKIIFVFVLFFTLSINTFALGEDNGKNDYYVAENFPKEMSDILKENDFSELSYQNLLNINLSDIFSVLKNSFKKSLKGPIKTVLSILAIIMIFSIIFSVSSDLLNESAKNILQSVFVLCICTISSSSVISFIIDLKNLIANMLDFSKSIIPVLSGVMILGGKSVFVSQYNAIALTLAHIVESALSSIIIPLVYFLIALTIVMKISPDNSLDGIFGFVKTTINTVLSFSMVIFISFISIKGIISSSADSVALRTGKFFLGNFVPAVGSALSESAAFAQTGASLIGKTTSIYAFISISVYALPYLLKAILFKISCNICSAVSEIFGMNTISSLTSEFSSIFSVNISIMLCSFTLILFSTVIITLLF